MSIICIYYTKLFFLFFYRLRGTRQGSPDAAAHDKTAAISGGRGTKYQQRKPPGLAARDPLPGERRPLFIKAFRVQCALGKGPHGRLILWRNTDIFTNRRHGKTTRRNAQKNRTHPSKKRARRQKKNLSLGRCKISRPTAGSRLTQTVFFQDFREKERVKNNLQKLRSGQEKQL